LLHHRPDPDLCGHRDLLRNQRPELTRHADLEPGDSARADHDINTQLFYARFQGSAVMTEVSYEQLFMWSIERVRQQKLIAALKAENEILRARLRLADARRPETIAFFKPQIGPTS
jgi:hypothetical protein